MSHAIGDKRVPEQRPDVGLPRRLVRRPRARFGTPALRDGGASALLPSPRCASWTKESSGTRARLSPRSESRVSSGQQMRRPHPQFAWSCGAANVASEGYSRNR